MEDKWFISNENLKEKEGIRCQLFLFPYAGVGALAFKEWKNSFKNIKLFLAQYPGRENRIKEELIEDFNVLIERIYSSISKYIFSEVPYYLFGHSLGTKIVYELALRIKRDTLPQPKGIIISAGKAPCFKEKNPIYKLKDEDFIREINRFSGIPKEIIQNLEIMKIFLPILRADFMLDETYNNNINEKIDSPILGLMGTQDQELTLQEFLKWREYTNSTFSYKFIEGGHLFIKTNMEVVIEEIIKFVNKSND